MAKKRGDGIFEVESAETYKQLVGQVFSGTYVGLQENKDYGTERAVFQINQEDPHNKGLLQLFSTIRKLNDQSNTKVRLPPDLKSWAFFFQCDRSSAANL